MEPNWKWWASRDEEVYSGPYDTREEAIEVGTADYDGEPFYIVEAMQGNLNLRAFWDDDILDRLQDHNEERVDPDGYLFRKEPTAEQKRDLADMVNDAVEAWAAKHAIDIRAWTFAERHNPERIEPSGGAA